MSSYLVIAAVSKAIQQVLWDAFHEDDLLSRHVHSQEEIDLRNPTEAARDTSHRMSLWLYDITENEFLHNNGAHRAEGREFPALSLNLHYLVTPLMPTPEADLLLIGKTMQVMNDNPVVLLRDELDDVYEELRIGLSRLTVEEMSQIWGALQEPYRLSICYQVKATRIQSTRPLGEGRVFDRFFGLEHRAGPGA